MGRSKQCQQLVEWNHTMPSVRSRFMPDPSPTSQASAYALCEGRWLGRANTRETYRRRARANSECFLISRFCFSLELLSSNPVILSQALSRYDATCRYIPTKLYTKGWYCPLVPPLDLISMDHLAMCVCEGKKEFSLCKVCKLCIVCMYVCVCFFVPFILASVHVAFRCATPFGVLLAGFVTKLPGRPVDRTRQKNKSSCVLCW